MQGYEPALGTRDQRGVGSIFFTYKEFLHRREDLNTLRKVATVQLESIMILIVFHPLTPRKPRNDLWGGGEGAILIPG